MNKIARDLYVSAAKMDSSKVRLVVFIITLAMATIIAGAPEAGGGITFKSLILR